MKKKLTWSKVVYIIRAPSYSLPCPGGEIGRRKGFKIPRWKHRAGSSPALGTIHISQILLYSPKKA